MSIQLIRSKLDEVLHFLQPYMSFINCHMVDYLTGSLWEVYVPQKIKDEIRSESDVGTAIEAFWSREKFPGNQRALSEFIKEAEHYSLENFAELCGQDDLFKQLRNSCKDVISIKEFMSEKKGHEVETAAKLIHDLISLKREGSEKEIYVVDAGDGKGYLSSRLALQFNFKVLGIDANEVNTEGAKKRSNRLERAWNGLTQRAALIKEGKVPPRRRKRITKEDIGSATEKFNSTNSENYKTINEFIVPELDLVAIVQEHFDGAEDPEICLCGLHTCGNLASTCLELFHAQRSIKILFNVGCCYHLLNEKFPKDDNLFVNQEIAERNPHHGFPMSAFLCEKSFSLGRNARMLASQSIHRTRTNKELPNKSLFYRALLEMLLKENAPELRSCIQVGKIRKFESFKEYVEKCSRKFSNLNFSSLDNDYNSLLERHSRDAKLLDLFYLIRMSFAPVIETVILLDRLLFLKENGIDKSFIVPLFDPVISPRRFAIVSFKQ